MDRHTLGPLAGAARTRSRRTGVGPLRRVDAVEHTGNLDHVLDGGIEPAALRKTHRPMRRRALVPWLGRLAHALAGGSAVALGDEVLKRAADIAQRRATLRAVKGRRDDG